MTAALNGERIEIEISSLTCIGVFHFIITMIVAKADNNSRYVKPLGSSTKPSDSPGQASLSCRIINE